MNEPCKYNLIHNNRCPCETEQIQLLNDHIKLRNMTDFQQVAEIQRLTRKVDDLHRCVAMLKSMINCGESFTEQSQKEVQEALNDAPRPRSEMDQHYEDLKNIFKDSP